jgi:hypothetical protein
MIMGYVVAFFVGVALGVGAMFAILLEKRASLRREHERLRERARHTERERETTFQQRRKVDQEAAQVEAERRQFEERVIAYDELQNENAILKRDLRNIDVELRKLQLDRQLQRDNQQRLDERVGELGARYLRENVKWIGASITPNNFVASKQRLQAVIERCRGIGFAITSEEEDKLLADLRAEYEKVVRAALEREEQARIKAQIREEQRLEREIERELKQLERERTAIKAALKKALAEAKDKHSEEVQRLEQRLAEAEEKSQRVKSRAEMTKSGHVYVISNIGSFGEGMFKIGMTRRLEPADRVKELGDASVPFPFDVHMMISSNDAPKLENALHGALHSRRVNRVNPRKEFFRIDLDTVVQIVENNHGKVDYVADAEALEYRQSQQLTEEDAEYIEGLYESMAEGQKRAGAED